MFKNQIQTEWLCYNCFVLIVREQIKGTPSLYLVLIARALVVVFCTGWKQQPHISSRAQATSQSLMRCSNAILMPN